MNILNIIRESFSEHIIFSVGLLLIAGYFFGKLFEKIKLPTITGYIFAGIIIGTSGLQLIHEENFEGLHLLSEITLSFIAVIIGSEFSFSKLKKLGYKIIILTLGQMFITFVIVVIGLLALGLSSYIALLLGAISAATAPAATVVIVEKLRARGTFVDYLYGIVALDDAGTIILFSIVFALSAILIGSSNISLTKSLLHGIMEIGISIIIGIVGGFIINLFAKTKKSVNELKIISLGIIFLTTSINLSLHYSPLISNMAIGMVLINMNKKNIRILHSLEPITAPLYAIFFAVAGIELNLQLFLNWNILAIGMALVALRGLGKYLGIFLPSFPMKIEPKIRNYLGLSLLPQAGVAIGLGIFVKGSELFINSSVEIQTEINQMLNLLLFSVLINEIIGPLLSQIAILKNLNRRT
ncbi:MAG: putative sulfate exporter family transporter [Candidatus Marinimicrobia bacterium]|nr:putative sulfate exporter family transporter [Candidatus Neomarinimicrobiota bacterium]